MSDTNNPNPGGDAGDKKNNVTTPTGGTDPNKTEPGEGASTIDTSKFTQADWDKIYNDNKLYDNPRFKSLNEQAKKAKVLEDQQADAAKTKLAEEKKFQELAEAEKKEKLEWKDKATQASVNNAIQLAAIQAGVVDVDAALKLIDKSKVVIDETGNVVGAADAIKALVEAKPYLKDGKNKDFSVGGGTNPGSDNTNIPRFTLSQIKDSRFYKAHEKEILQAQKAGLLIDDTKK